MKTGTFLFTSRLVGNIFCLTFYGFRSFSSLTSAQVPLFLGCLGRGWRGKFQSSALDSGPAGLLLADGLVYGMASVSEQIGDLGFRNLSLQVESGGKKQQIKN